MITRETLVSSQILGPARPPTGQNILGAGIDPARIGVRAPDFNLPATAACHIADRPDETHY